MAIPPTISRWAARGTAPCCGPSRAEISPACFGRIEEGYFDSLGVDAIWMTPFVEQIHGSVDEGTGKTYGFHGYWTRDWTAVDPAARQRRRASRRRGRRAPARDPRDHGCGDQSHRPADRAGSRRGPRTGFAPTPNCAYRDYASTVDCTLVATLPDIRTERDAPVALPPPLLEKWEQEGRREREVAELDAYFTRTGHPRAPRYYIIKWLTDWVREFGFDGYRIDTAKHFGETVATELKREAETALAEWRREHPGEGRDDLPFYMVGEVYGWEPGNGRAYDFGDRKVDYFAHGYDALINFGFKRDAAGSLDSLFAGYAGRLHGQALRGAAILNYVSSHDDGSPYDAERKDPHRRRHPPPARPWGRADLLRRRGRAPAPGRGRRRRRQPPLQHDLEPARSGHRGRARALAEAGALPPGPSGGGRRRAPDPAGRAVHFQPESRDRRSLGPRAGGNGPGQRERGRCRCSASFLREPSSWTSIRVRQASCRSARSHSPAGRIWSSSLRGAS